jgi:predicted ATPase
LLLVLDNCEHVLDASAQLVNSITRQCAGVRILATSREPLEVSGENVFRLQSLTDAEGAQLFRDRALAAGAIGELNMETLTRISHRVDGIPLAIELAAARCGAMSPEDIERRLDDRFQLLRGARRGRIERHQSLHHTVRWSYELLQLREQHVFDRLSLFAGGFTLEAAQDVAGGQDFDDLEVEEAISALVAQSMILAMDAGNTTRYRLLETLRQFGEERLLASGETLDTRQRQVRYFADFMNRAWAGLWSESSSFWIRAIGHEFENLRVAVYTAIDLGDREALGALLKPLHFWAWHSLRYEVGDWAEAALQATPEPAFARSIAVCLRFHGGRPEDARRLVAGLEDIDESADPDMVCLSALGHLCGALASQSPKVSDWMQRAIAGGDRTGNPALATLLKSMQVVFKTMAGEMDAARRIAIEAFEQAKSLGNPITLCEATFFMGRAHADVDPKIALEYFDRVVEIAEREGLPFYAGIAATEAAAASVRVEETDLSVTRLCRALRAFIRSGDRGQLWNSAHHLVYFLSRTGRSREALRIWQGLGSRRAYVSQHYREELMGLIGPPGEGTLSDDELIVQILEVLDRLDR